MRVTLLVLTLLTSVLVGAAEWPQWFGPNRDGKSAETGLMKRWPDGGPPRVWETRGLGEGFSSFAVAGGRLYTQGQRDGKQYLMAFAVADGKKLWETANGGTYSNRRGSGPRGTPTLDGDRVYALASNGRLLCADTTDGKEIWAVDLLGQFGGSNTHWGISESPLIDGDRVIVTPGGSNGGLVALSKNTGKVIWRSESDRAGYSSAVVAEIGGVRQYITLTATAGLGVRADDGKVLWRYSQVANRTANVATPIVRGDRVFLSSDYGTGCALLRLKPANGGIDAEEIYFNRDMRNHYSTSVLVGDHLYGYSSRIFTCMRFDTGQVAWQDRAVGKGQVIYGDGLLYLLSEGGAVALVEPSPDGYKEISRFEIGRGDYPTWTLPVIADGKLYLRDQDKLSSYNIQAR